jgi:hypothetical protein
MEIVLQKSRLKEVLEVLKHLVDKCSSSPASDKLLVRSEPGRIILAATTGAVDVCRRIPAPEIQAAVEPFVVLISPLSEIAKGEEGPVQLSGNPGSPVEMEELSGVPTEMPKRLHHTDWPSLRLHFLNAGNVVANDRDRYALTHICLTQDSIVGTDGHHLYAAGGLDLPLRKGQRWLAVPAKVFASKELSGIEKVGLARDDQGLSFHFGDVRTAVSRTGREPSPGSRRPGRRWSSPKPLPRAFRNVSVSFSTAPATTCASASNRPQRPSSPRWTARTRRSVPSSLPTSRTRERR